MTEKIEKAKELDTKTLDSLKTDELDNELDQILKRNDKFHKILVKIGSCLYSSKQLESEFSSLSIHSSNNTSNKVKIKLPKLELFKFNGDITMWQTFWDQFNSSFHYNEDIRDVNKFNYLPSFICDEAREMISELAPTSSNYKTAVDILQKRYGNTQVWISSFMNKFVTLAKLKNDKDIKALRKLLDQTESSI